jgi:hypothetical protein
MANTLQRGAAWLAGQLQQHASRPAMYLRGGIVIALVPATVAKNTYQVTDIETGVVTNVIAFDFTIRRKMLKTAAGTQIEPREGDQIRITLNSTPMTYEVLPVADRQCWEWADTSGIMITVHTKEV